MLDLDVAQINIKDGGDELALQYLGAAVILTWARLPQDVRELLLTRSSMIAGLPVRSSSRKGSKRCFASTRSRRS